MKKLLAFAALFTTSLATSQITLDASRMTQVGDRYTTVRVDTTGFTEGLAGANRTWNFADVTLLQEQTELQYVAVPSTPFGQEFPNATLASMVSDVNPVYSYMRNSGNQLLSYGSRSQDFSLVYNNPMVMRQFPFTYNTNFADTYSGVMTIDTSMQVRSGGTITVVGDGYGTIVLPGGQSRKSLRMKFHRVNHDTTEIPGFPPIVTTTTLTSYEWFIAESKFPVMILSYSRSEGLFGTTNYKFIEYHAGGATDVKRNDDIMPSSFALEQNHPNPFNPSTTISFSLTHAAPVQLKVYNLIGQEVATLVNEELPRGMYAVPFDAKGLASGTYFYRLESQGTSLTRRMSLLK